MTDRWPELRDPRTLYPGPTFPRQPQPAPGLAAVMDPVPDHGEASYRGSGRLAGRRALVTGGDSGLGRAAAIAFAREGADVALGFLPTEGRDAADVALLIEAEGRRAVLLPGDITDESFCRNLVAHAARELGGLDVLVNNAGAQSSKPSLADITRADFDRVMRTNLYALLWITQAAVPLMPPGSAIINTASVQAYEPSQGVIDDAVTKAGIVALTKALSKQALERGIRVNAVAPGPFWTPLQPSGGQTQEKVEAFGSQVPFGRPGQPTEIAPVASAEASYVTGEVYGVTGGIGIA